MKIRDEATSIIQQIELVDKNNDATIDKYSAGEMSLANKLKLAARQNPTHERAESNQAVLASSTAKAGGDPVPTKPSFGNDADEQLLLQQEQ